MEIVLKTTVHQICRRNRSPSLLNDTLSLRNNGSCCDNSGDCGGIVGGTGAVCRCVLCATPVHVCSKSGISPWHKRRAATPAAAAGCVANQASCCPNVDYNVFGPLAGSACKGLEPVFKEVMNTVLKNATHVRAPCLVVLVSPVPRARARDK